MYYEKFLLINLAKHVFLETKALHAGAIVITNVCSYTLVICGGVTSTHSDAPAACDATPQIPIVDFFTIHLPITLCSGLFIFVVLYLVGFLPTNKIYI